KLPHTEIVLRPEAVLSALPGMVTALDEPYAGGLPSWFVFEGMGRHVKVALTGTGGDEMFGNYGKWRPLEDRLRNVLGLPTNPGCDRFRRQFFQNFYYFADSDKRRVLPDRGADCRDTSTMLFERLQATQARNVRDGTACLDIATQLPEEFLAM